MKRLLRMLCCAALGLSALHAQTGVAVPEFESVDRDIQRLMADAQVVGGAVAIVKDGRLVFARGYGLANRDTGEAFQPDSLCRVGSISKTITATTILRLVESGRLNLDDRVFDDILTGFDPPPGTNPDPRLCDITVRRLLHHTGGHGRDTGTDPLSIRAAFDAAQAFHLPMPPGYDATVRYGMGLPLDFDPGTRYSYSNYGFMVLARVIEKVAGQPYDDVVRHQVLAPIGIGRMALGRTLPQDRRPGEARYYDTPRSPLIVSVLPGVRRLLPAPYANFEVDAADGCGGWVASAVDLAKLVARVEGSRPPALLLPQTLQLMFEKPDPFVSQDPTGRSWYGLGTVVAPYGAGMLWTHGGFYPGSVSGYESFGDGYVFAFVFNSTPNNSTFTSDVYRVLETVGQNQKDWPSHDLFPRYYPED